MAHKVWSDEEVSWIEATDERVKELQQTLVEPGTTVALPPVDVSNAGVELPHGLQPSDTLWMIFNENRNLDRARP